MRAGHCNKRLLISKTVIVCFLHLYSASNLSASESQQERRLSEQNNSRLRSRITTLEKSLEESKKENQQLQTKVS